MPSTPMQTDDLMRLAKEHHTAGRLGPAEDLYHQVLAQSPNDAEVRHMLGLIAYQVGKADMAVARIQSSLRLNPSNPTAYKNLSAAMKAARRFADAADIARRAIELAPEDAGAYGNLGNALGELGRFDEALIAYQRAVQLRPESAQDWSNLGGGLVDLGRFDEAIAAHKRAIALSRELAEAHWNLALALLTRGDFNGWKGYEWRWKFDGFTSVRRNFPQPLWDGKPLDGRRLLLHAEQGHGDTIQFIRYLPRIAERAKDGILLLECQPRLILLLRECSDMPALISAGGALPIFDVHCPLMSLPLVLNETADSIPRRFPYIRIDSARIAKWAESVGKGDGRLRVGIAWAGSPTNRCDHRRSLRLAQLASFFSVGDVVFFSLQIDARDEVAASRLPNLIDLTQHQHDFAETAALIHHLDLIVTVDTSLAHLAGAMNKPTWVLLSHAADWRWMQNRDDSPWYSSVRLFRQKVPNEWDEPIRRVRDELDKLAARRRSATPAI